MQILDTHSDQLIDRVIHEGDPELWIGPLTIPPADIPLGWTKALTARDPTDQCAAVLRLWKPMEDRLPRVCRALRDRLRGVGLLRTAAVPASLIYFFSDGDDWFEFRGRLPVDEDRLSSSPLPADFLDFYRLHDGWVLYHTEDEGPVPSAEWGPVEDLWEGTPFGATQWNVPPGEVSFESFRVVFRGDEELTFGFDTSVEPALPLLCRANGTVEILGDMWAAIDDRTGAFLETLDQARAESAWNALELAECRRKAERRCEDLLKRFGDVESAAMRLGGAAFYEQWWKLLVQRAQGERESAGKPETIADYYRRALRQWCKSMECGALSEPKEVVDFFAVAHSVGDEGASQFIAALPLGTWTDDSLDGIQARVLFQCLLGDVEMAAAELEILTGLTDPLDPGSEITLRLLESLCHKNRSAYAAYRRRFIEHDLRGSIDNALLIPRDTRLVAYEAVAFRLGLVDKVTYSL